MQVPWDGEPMGEWSRWGWQCHDEQPHGPGQQPRGRTHAAADDGPTAGKCPKMFFQGYNVNCLINNSHSLIGNEVAKAE